MLTFRPETLVMTKDSSSFGDDLVGKTKRAKIAACRARLQSAGRAAQKLEQDVRWLVKQRAWDVLDYEDFSTMWEKECGFVPPRIVRNVAADALGAEGAHSPTGISRLLGVPLSTACALEDQREAGDAIADRVGGTQYNAKRKLAEPQKRNKRPNEMCDSGFYRWQEDAFETIRRQTGNSVAELKRQAADEFLAKRVQLWQDGAA